jgi:hypothetical protein
VTITAPRPVVVYRNGTGPARDWEAVRARYVEGVPHPGGKARDWPTLDRVATHFGISSAGCKERSSAEGWVEQRAAFRGRLAHERQELRVAELSRAAVEIDGQVTRAAKNGIALATARLAEIGRAQQARNPELGDPPAVDARELLAIAQAVGALHQAALRALGERETTRVEHAGPSGGPVEIRTELTRDDPGRLAGVLGVLISTGVFDHAPLTEGPHPA